MLAMPPQRVEILLVQIMLPSRAISQWLAMCGSGDDERGSFAHFCEELLGWYAVTVAGLIWPQPILMEALVGVDLVRIIVIE